MNLFDKVKRKQKKKNIYLRTPKNFIKPNAQNLKPKKPKAQRMILQW